MDQHFTSISVRPGFRASRTLHAIGVLLLGLALLTEPSATATAQESKQPAVASRLKFEGPEKQLWQAGLKVTAVSTIGDLYATFTVPSNWPEQTVQVVDQEVSRYVTGWEARDLPGGVKQVRVKMANVPSGTSANVLFTFEVTKSRTLLVGENNDLVIPKATDRATKIFLGNSPFIDPRHGKIRKIATDIEAEAAGEPAWERVHRIYDFVRDNVEYREGDIKAATKALDDGFGDCEEMTSLFIAICRASRIPARMVWVPGHCYPEFMLADSEGNQHWFPCQAAGTAQFGEMDEYKPILQKGDRFKVPEKRELQRYVAEHCKITRTKTKPQVTFVRELLTADE